MKKIMLFLLILVSSIQINAQSDSLVVQAVTNAILEESNQFRVLIYLYRLTNGKSPSDHEDFENYLIANQYNSDFEYLDNVEFYDTNKVAYHFTFDGGDELEIGDSTRLKYLHAEVTSDFFTNYSSTIHSFMAQIDSAAIFYENKLLTISSKESDLLFIRFEESDISSIKVSVNNQYDENTPEYVVVQSREYIKKQDWISLASIFDLEDLNKMKDAFDYVINSEKGNELLTSFEGISSKKEFLQLTSKKFLPVMMKFLWSINPQMAFLSMNLKSKILGTVRENDLVHVLVRNEVNVMGKKIEQLDVETTRLVHGRYYIKNEDINQMVVQFKAMVDQS